MIILSDYDGTYDQMNAEEKSHIDGIVTGTSWTDNHIPVQDIDVPIFFNPDSSEHPTLGSVISHKAHVLKSSKCDVFYEDQQVQADTLRILVPSCTIKLREHS